MKRVEESKEILEIIKDLPADSYEEGQEVCEKLLAGGPATIELLVAMVGQEFGDPDGVQPKYALRGMVHHASRPGADEQRKMLAKTLAGQLDADHSDELKAFVVRQLQLCGSADEVPALAKLLSSDRLCDPAAQALSAIGGSQVEKALNSALSGATGSRKVTIEQAIAFVSAK